MNKPPTLGLITCATVAAMLLLIAAGAAGAAESRNATGQVFVSSEKDDTVAAYSAASRQLIAVWRQCKRPRHLQLSPDRRRLYEIIEKKMKKEAGEQKIKKTK